MAETTSDVRIVISEELPSNLTSRLEALNLSLVGNAEAGCLALQQFFTLLTLYCVRSAESTLSETFPDRSTSLAKTTDSLRDLRFKLAAAIDELATLPEEHPGASLFFRIFYVGGVKAKDTSPRRHARLLEVGGKNIPGYRTLVEWCELNVGQDELKGEQRCNRELRRYLPVAKEWLQAIGKHTAKLPEVKLDDAASPQKAPEPAPADSKPKIQAEPPKTVAEPASTTAAKKSAAVPDKAGTEAPKASVGKAEPTATGLKSSNQELVAAAAQPQSKVDKVKPAAAKAAAPTEVKATAAEKPAPQAAKTEKATAAKAADSAKNAATKVEPSTTPKEAEAVRPATRKAEPRSTASRTSSATKGHVPSIFTSPLKEMLVATQAKQTEKVNRQLSLISVRILQYSYSIGLATLEALDQSTTSFRLESKVLPNSYRALELKTEKLSLIEQYFQENSEDLAELESTIDLIQRLLAETLLSRDILLELAKLPTREGFASETTWAAKGLTKIKGWIEKAMPFCSRAEHYLDESTEDGVTFGVVQFGDWALEFEEKNLRIYSEFLTESQVAEIVAAAEVSQAQAVEPAAEVVPEAKAVEPVAEVVSEAKAVEPVAEVVPEAKAVEPVTEVVPEAKAVEPVTEVVPEAKAVEPVAEVVPEAKAVEPVTEVVPEAKAVEPVAEVVPEAKAVEPVAEVVPEAKAVEPVAEVVPEAKAVEPVAEVVPEPVPVVTKARHLTAKQKKAEASKITLAQAILAGTAPTIEVASTDSTPAEQLSAEPATAESTPSAPEIVVCSLTPEELDAEIVFSLQHCGAPSFLKLPWSSGQPLELRARALCDLWGQYFSSVLTASETIREVEHCAGAAPRSQGSLKNQLVAFKSIDVAGQLGTELAAVFWGQSNAELGHTQFLSALASEALCYPIGDDQLKQWLSALKQWVEASQDFWGATEQLFEEPDSEGNLEGVAVYGEQYLEIVEHPLDLNFPQAWAEAAPVAPQLLGLPEAESPKPDLVNEPQTPEAPAATLLNLEWDLVENAPPHILEQLEKFKSGELSREQALRQSYYFLLQYYAGVLACAGVQLRDLDVGMIEAFTHDSTIEARREMLEQLLPDSLVSESDVFKELAQVWNSTDGQSIQICSTTNFLKASCSEELSVEWQSACSQWLRNSNHFWQHCEHHCEESDDQRQDIVVQFKGDFFELVHPDYSLELAPKVAPVPESEIIEAIAAIASQSSTNIVAAPEVSADLLAEAAPASPSDLLLGAASLSGPASDPLLESIDGGLDSLFVGAASPSDLLLDGPPSLEGVPAVDSDSLFGAQSASPMDIDSLFQVEPETDWIGKLNQPTPVVEAPAPVKPKPTAPDPLAQLFAVQSETDTSKPVETAQVVEEPKTKVRPAPKEDPLAAVDNTPKVSQSTTVVTDLLDSILSESEAKKAKAKESSDREALEKAEKEKIEVAAKAEIAAIEAGVTPPTGVPTLEVIINYEEKKQGVHTGTLVLKNIGGGTLKGTLKSLHPSVRLRPTVFRENDTIVEFTIDDSDKPSNLKKNALAVNLQGGAKQELNFDRLLPAAGLAQIRTKVFDLVKQLGKAKKPKA